MGEKPTVIRIIHSPETMFYEDNEPKAVQTRKLSSYELDERSATEHIMRGASLVAGFSRSFATSVAGVFGLSNKLAAEARQVITGDMTPRPTREMPPVLRTQSLPMFRSDRSSDSEKTRSSGKPYLRGIRRKPASPVTRRPLEKDFAELEQIVIHP